LCLSLLYLSTSSLMFLTRVSELPHTRNLLRRQAVGTTMMLMRN
jgi:hypothetical protein